MARIHVERELQPQNLPAWAGIPDSSLHPLGLQSPFSPQLLTYHSTEVYFYSSWEKQLKNHPNQNKTPQRNNNKPPSKPKTPPKTPRLPRFLQIFSSSHPSASCNPVLYETGDNFTTQESGTSFKNKHLHACPKNNQSQLQGTRRQREQKCVKELLKPSLEDVRFSMLRKAMLILLQG